MTETLKLWQWEPNFPVTMKYAFLTVVERNERFWEQRRPRLAQAVRAQSCDFVETGRDGQKFLNDLRLVGLNAVAVPVFSEALHPIVNLNGLTTLEVSEAVADYWNASRAEIVLIKSISDSALAQLRAVSQINSNSFVVTAAITQAFTVADTVIYPCFPGAVTSFTPTAETSQLVRAKLEFKEVFLEWAL